MYGKRKEYFVGAGFELLPLKFSFMVWLRFIVHKVFVIRIYYSK